MEEEGAMMEKGEQGRKSDGEEAGREKRRDGQGGITAGLQVDVTGIRSAT